MLTVNDIREALRVCFDPELAVNIVDLGLVDSIGIEVDTQVPGSVTRHIVRIALLGRSTDENRNALMHGQIVNRLLGMPEISRAFADLSQKGWTPDCMNDTARIELGIRAPRADTLVQIKPQP